MNEAQESYSPPPEEAEDVRQAATDIIRKAHQVKYNIEAGERNLQPTQVLKDALHIGKKVTPEDVMIEDANTMNEQFDAEHSQTPPEN